MSSVTALELPGVPALGSGGSALAGGGSTTGVYLAGPENRVVATAIGRLIEIASDPSAEPPVGWSPVTLVGPTGSGKSLLAGAIATGWERQREQANVLTLNGVDFRRRLDEAIASESTEAFRDRVRNADLLVLENLHRLPPAQHVRNELTATLDAINERGGLVIATSLKPLSETPGFDRAIVSRFASGLMLELAPAAAETRAELLRRSLEAIGCRVDTAAAGELATSLSGDARRVLRVANQLRERFGVRRPIGCEQVRAFLAEQKGPASPPLRYITSVVAKYYRLSVREMRSSSRKQPIVLSRAVAIYLARELTPLSYDEIGRYYGGRDHSTIMHNYQRIDGALATDRALRSAVDELRAALAT